MARANHMVLAKICIQAQGDLGLFTTYTSTKLSGRSNGAKNRRIIFFPKIWLSDPTSRRQLQNRNKWRAAATWWRALQPIERTNWETACRRLYMPLTGYNLFIYWRTAPNSTSDVHTIERQSGVSLLPTSLG